MVNATVIEEKVAARERGSNRRLGSKLAADRVLFFV